MPRKIYSLLNVYVRHLWYFYQVYSREIFYFSEVECEYP